MTRPKGNANQPKQSTLELQVSHDQTVHQDHLFIINDKKLVTSSRIVAQFLKRQHKNVLRNIEALRSKLPKEFDGSNFEPSSYLNEQNKKQPMYLLTKDGLFFLLTRFTGKLADKLRIMAYMDYSAQMTKLEKLQYGTPHYSLLELRGASHFCINIGKRNFYLYYAVAKYLGLSRSCLRSEQRVQYAHLIYTDKNNMNYVSEEFVLKMMMQKEATKARVMAKNAQPIGKLSNVQVVLFDNSGVSKTDNDLFTPLNA